MFSPTNSFVVRIFYLMLKIQGSYSPYIVTVSVVLGIVLLWPSSCKIHVVHVRSTSIIFQSYFLNCIIDLYLSLFCCQAKVPSKNFCVAQHFRGFSPRLADCKTEMSWQNMVEESCSVCGSWEAKQENRARKKGARDQT